MPFRCRCHSRSHDELAFLEAEFAVQATSEHSRSSRLVAEEMSRPVNALEMISTATDQQSEQARLISEISGELSTETAHGRRAIATQSSSSRHLEDMTRDLAKAAEKIRRSVQDQKAGSGVMVGSMGRIGAVSQRNLEATRRIRELIDQTRDQWEELRQEVNR